MRAGVPGRTTSRAGRAMQTVHIDLAGPYGVIHYASVAESLVQGVGWIARAVSSDHGDGVRRKSRAEHA